MENQNPKSKGILTVGGIPAVPLIIVGIWLLCWPLLSYGVITKPVCTGIVLGTMGWFIVWLWRSSRRG